MIKYEMRYAVKAMNTIERSVFYRWKCIKSRCCNPGDACYADYGGRGISICDAWRQNFMQFVKDVGLPADISLELDRINNNGNYEPGNVRWVPRQTNMQNVRNNKYVTIDGVTKLASQWADEAGISRSTFCIRQKLGWTGTKLISKPSERVTSERITIGGVTKTAKEWSQAIGISIPGLKRRIDHGLPVEEVLRPSQKASRHSASRSLP